MDEAYLERLGKQSREADDAAKDAVRKKKKETKRPRKRRKLRRKEEELMNWPRQRLRRQRLRRQRLRRQRLRNQRHRQRRNSRSNEKSYSGTKARHCLHHHLQRKTAVSIPSSEPIGVFDEGLMANTVGKLTSLMDDCATQISARILPYASTDGKPENTMLNI